MPDTALRSARRAGVNCTAIHDLLNAVFPHSCRLCGADAGPGPRGAVGAGRGAGGGNGWACHRHALPEALPGPRCRRCAARLPEAMVDGSRCPGCRRRSKGLGRAIACFDWRAQPEVHPWVFALKYGGRQDLAEPLGRLLGERFLAQGAAPVTPGRGRLSRVNAVRADSDRSTGLNGLNGPTGPTGSTGPIGSKGRRGTLFTHLPLHPKRRFERGYDQAEWLARHAADAAGVGYAACLQRVRSTVVQGGPGAVSRAANVRGAFGPRPGLGTRAGLGPWLGSRLGARFGTGFGAGPGGLHRPLAGVEVWLVDDVLTTGASAAEAIGVLRSLGAAPVGALVLVRAGGEEGRPLDDIDAVPDPGARPGLGAGGVPRGIPGG